MKGKHLAIQITEDSARFVFLKDDRIVDYNQLSIEGLSSDEIRKSIGSHFESISFLKNDFDEISLSWSTKQSTLIPNNIFAESSAKSIYELCYGKYDGDGSIDYNRIAELSIVNVFEIPDWIKRFFVIKFPRAIIQHEGTHTLRQIMKDAFKLKANVVLHKDFFQLTIVKHNNLEFYSSFDYQSSEDLLYHLLFALQQKEFTDEDGSIEFVLGPDASKATLTDTLEKLERIKDLSKFRIEQPDEYISKSQLLCV